MTDRVTKILEIAKRELGRSKSLGFPPQADFYVCIEILEASRIPLEELDEQISSNILKTIENLLDPETSASAEYLAAGIDRLRKMLEVQIEMLSLTDDTAYYSPDSAKLFPTYELDADEKERIFSLCSQMRKIVLSANGFDEPHRLRLLNRIAAIEAETHKPKGMLDVVLGGVTDVGETLGKFGKDIKPLTDRMKEVAGIARKGTKEYDQIPAPEEVKQLPAPEASEVE